MLSYVRQKKRTAGCAEILFQQSSKKEEDSDICILLAASLNNLIPIRSACVVGGKRFIERFHSRLGFCLSVFSWHLSCMF